ncbi:TRAP transporter small permease [Ciceribacter sp. RN22]|uniref:TRAP transporter small permease n=1 Tax=Ciceribacter sp. RN22 TaxID=2954932 RepID=UPI002092A4A9|nr:TRAP transporter small permease [Ciceribacter sp. RN22]MCO6179644.1 TRAP transporter small permease [Ciceribacter sp. RN22]
MSASFRKHPVGNLLDRLYLLAGYLAAACLMGLLVVIVMQMVARWTDLTFPGGTQYAGYLMAASTFLAFAYTLNSGGHIRVELLLQALGKSKFLVELWCLLVGTAASSYLAWYAVKLVYWSRKLHDLSQGLDATPLWYVQIPVAAGAIILAVCFADNLVTVIFTRRDNINQSAEAGLTE